MNICYSCGRPIGSSPNMEIYTVESKKFRVFCLECIKNGYKNLSNLKNRTESQEDVMLSFGVFIKKHTKKRRAES